MRSQSWAGLAPLFLNIDQMAIDGETARTLGASYHAMMIGVMAQQLMDPKQAPSAREITEALQVLTAMAHGESQNTNRRTRKRRPG